MIPARIVPCTFERHAPTILDIFNDAIVNSTALYDYHPRPIESMTEWFAGKRAGGFPVIGAEDEAGALMGFATFGTFRARPAYKYTVEHSVYVDRRYRRRGVARVLMHEIIAMARVHGVHVMVGGIDIENTASIALHVELGFVHAGTIPQAGFKFGRWLDLAFYQLTLETPADPVDG